MGEKVNSFPPEILSENNLPTIKLKRKKKSTDIHGHLSIWEN